MNIAFLFNSDDERYGGSYGDPIRSLMLKTGILQASDRHMKMSVGDVLIYSNARSSEDYDKLTNLVYFSNYWSKIIYNRLIDTFRTATVYALTFENMTKELALTIHSELSRDKSYLGVMQVEYSYGPHLTFFRNFMITKYRLKGKICRVFFSMNEEDGKDEYELTALRNLGFEDVSWEDRGAHGTIFDDYDTLDHFEQVAMFRDTIATHLSGGSDAASELVMVLEDLNPQLFNALGAAVRALKSARNEEDVAQAAISGRRYFEKLADVLFPSRTGKYNGREVGTSQYRNRIWAYISDNLSNDNERISAIGRELDRLDSEFNAGLHSDKDSKRILKALVDTSSLTAELLSLNPDASRQPYYAHRKKIIEFMREVVSSVKE